MVSDWELMSWIDEDITFINDDHELCYFNLLKTKIINNEELTGTERGRLGDLYNLVQKRASFKY